MTRSANLAWASEDWDLGDDLDVVKDAIANAIDRPGASSRESCAIDADSALYSFAMRGEHVESARRRESAGAPVGRRRTEARPLPYVRQLVQPALECLRRELSLRSKLGSRERDLGVRERDLSLMLEMSSNQSATGRCRRVRPDPEDRARTHGLRAGALWVPGQEHRTVDDPQRTAHVAGIAAARATASDGVDAAAAAHHRRQSHLQGGERRGRALQNSRLPGPPPLRARDGRAGAVQSAERARISIRIRPALPSCWRRKSTVIIQAQYDSSTGLMTRHAFERQAKALLASADESATHCILYLDIDRLHVINETFGMHVGDDVIVSVAECMAKALPPQALSARISGDRLAALIPNVGMDAAAQLAEHIRAAAAAIVPRAGQGSFEVSVSVGVAPIGPRRQCAGACAGDRGDRLQGGQGPRPQPRRSIPGLRSEHHPAAYRHPGHRQAARRARQRQLPARCAAHPAAARQLRPAALRVADPHARGPRRDHSARQSSCPRPSVIS